MMKNKITKLILCFFIAQILLYACCNNKEYNIFISSTDLNALDIADGDATTVTNENLRLAIAVDYETELISYVPKATEFLPTAYAITCLDDYTMINLVEQLKVEANVPLFGIDAGESLNSNVLATYFLDADAVITIENIIDDLNTQNNTNTMFFLQFDTVIPVDTVAQFKITFVFENGEILENTTTNITFE